MGNMRLRTSNEYICRILDEKKKILFAVPLRLTCRFAIFIISLVWLVSLYVD